jgi:hypothetical protein
MDLACWCLTSVNGLANTFHTQNLLLRPQAPSTDGNISTCHVSSMKNGTKHSIT